MVSDSDPATEPFPISRIAGRYLLFDPDVVRHARRNHNICGVLIGTIPNLSQQNIFLGIPLELTPEEARVLVEQGHAFVVDDVERHREGFMKMSREDRLKYLADMDKEGMEVSREGIQRAEQKTDRALKTKGLARKSKKANEASSSTATEASEDSSETLFDDASSAPPVAVAAPEKKLEPTFITPTTSDPPLSSPSPSEHAEALPVVPKSYPLFRYLHSRGYFSMPGLRFGCHYSVYPGDPLRFHSHFLATGMDWDEEFELLDVIGGGRLGTGVKKAYLIGGEDKDAKEEKGEKAEGGVVKAPVRAFSIEWAGL